MEQKATAVEIKAAQDGTFSGYAAVFGNVDSYGDIIQPGAFTKTIQERKSKIKILWNHDSSAPPVGKLVEIQEDAYGLKVTGQLATTPRGQEVLQLMREGVLDSMSIGYTTIKHEYEQREDLGREVRNLLELKLYEFSPVNFPANEAATITDVKRHHEAEALALQLLHYYQTEQKAGRTLSAANMARVKAALQELTALLEAAEPDAAKHTTPSAPADANSGAEPGTLPLGILDGLKSLNADLQKATALHELRTFGRSLVTLGG